MIKKIFVCLFIVTAFISAEDPSVLLTSATSRFLSAKNYRLEFDLTIFWSVREKYEKKSGLVVVAKGNKFYSKLGNSYWVSDGQTFWQYNKSVNQVVIKDLLDIDIDMLPAEVLKKLISLEFKFKLEDDKEAVFEWKASESKATVRYRLVRISINKSNGLISEIVAVDDDGNENRYNFKKIKFNENTDKGLFDFKIPKGADLFDTRK